jgi:DNA-directed RNA polymerase subunit beta'
MALELFKPFVMRKLVEQGLAHNIKSAKRFVERVRPEVWDVLEEVIHDHPVLLNRAPTLHRLGIQAFDAILVEGSAIQLHPLVCSAFNADFDGDQMAVHVPLSERAQEEARTLMLSSRNILHPATGDPSIGATQDMVLGCYYLTMERPDFAERKLEGTGLVYQTASDEELLRTKRFGVFSNTTEAVLAYETPGDAGRVKLQEPIFVRLDNAEVYQEPGKPTAVGPRRLVRTTVGRIIFNEELPEVLRFKNYPMKRDNLKQVIAECFKHYARHDPPRARQATADLADAIKRVGFTYATRGGASIAISDVIVPGDREEILSIADAAIAQLENDYYEGMITDAERYRRAVQTWTEATDKIQDSVQRVLDPYGSIYTIAMSGATKAKFQQIRQLSGMRGLMADPSGRIMELPVRGNFRDGLTVMEYFISSHGARKGLADTALRTAESGYLTRRLIDVSQDVIILHEDCGTTEGIWITAEDSAEMQEPFRNRLIGRTLQAPVEGFALGVGQELDDDTVDAMIAAGVRQVYCRSVLQCLAAHGVCRLCYGRNLAAGKLVEIGDAVGIIAAQSIGEPGTQLTMRTFHTGGIAGAQEDITQGLPRVEELFEARVPKDKAIISEIDGAIEVILEESGARKISVVSAENLTDEYPLPKGAEVLVREGEHVERDQVIARLPGKGKGAAAARAAAKVAKENKDGKETKDGKDAKNAKDAKEPEFDGPVIRAGTAGEISSISSEKVIVTFEERDEREYPVPAASNITVQNGQRVHAGQALTSGLIDPQDVLRIQGREAVHIYLVKEVQRVYRTTGVYINDKHIEVIVRQMLRRVRIDEPGDTDMLPNDLEDRFHYEETNARVLAEGGEPSTAQTVLLGVTKASLNTNSFLAAASFQETTRVLTEAAITGATDHLLGLKENVIIGKLIPAGTGVEQRLELREKQRADRLAQSMTGMNLPAFGMGTTGTNGRGEGAYPYVPTGADQGDFDLGLVDSGEAVDAVDAVDVVEAVGAVDVVEAGDGGNELDDIAPNEVIDSDPDA